MGGYGDFQFPLWWFSMPAIMKGWIDRVYAYGFAYGVGEHSDRHWGDRYGEGTLAGKRAMLIVTTGGWAEHYARVVSTAPSTTSCSPSSTECCSTRFSVLPPLVFYRTEKTDEQRFARQCRELGQRLDTLAETPHPVPPAKPRRLSDPPDAAPGAGAGECGFALHQTTKSCLPGDC
ncbi:hypothetical protein DMH27_17980 [Raoultella planticola]|nr:hypothetical protein [Raoultella planticola]